MRIAARDFPSGLVSGILIVMASSLTSALTAVLTGTLMFGSVGCSGQTDNTDDNIRPMSSSVSSSAASTPGTTGGSGVQVGDGQQKPVRGTVEVVDTLDHDPSLFTQGLDIADGRVYESTGRVGSSQVQHRPLDGGSDVVSVPFPAEHFGEGLAVTDDTVWTVTWQAGVATARDRDSLEPRSEVQYPGEGWGLCFDGTRLIMSDGSDKLTFRDPVTFAETGSIVVSAGGAPVSRLNELDCRGESILANVWMTNEIVRINPSDGAVTHIYDASALEQPRPSDPDAVLNGIAAVDGSDTVLLTGKLWPHLYEARLVG